MRDSEEVLTLRPKHRASSLNEKGLDSNNENSDSISEKSDEEIKNNNITEY